MDTKKMTSIEGKSFKFKVKDKICFLKVKKIKSKQKVFCDLVSLEKQKNDGSLVFNLHSGWDRRLYIFNSNIYSTATNMILDEVDNSTFEKLYKTAKNLKELTKGMPNLG